MKYLYNIGCSFSEGNGIAEARGGDFFNQGPTDKGKELEAKSRYSAVLSKKLGLEEINEAQGGGSNQRIFRKTWNWISKNKDKLDETFFVIQWSYPSRAEYYSGQERLKRKWFHVEYEKLVKDGMLPDVYTSSDITLRYILSLQSFFKQNNIKFIFFEGDDFTTMRELAAIHFTSKLGKLVDLSYWISDWHSNLPLSFFRYSGKELTPNGHPNEKMQIEWAGKIIKFIHEKKWL